MNKKIFISGASGTMGKQVLKHIMKADIKVDCNILLLNDVENKLFAHKVKRLYGNRLHIYFGDLSNYDDVKKATEDVEYIFHMGALIPPKADHYPNKVEQTNYYGTKNIIRAIKESGKSNEIKFVHISSVAVYGNRTYNHPWGRVGDPLFVSPYDLYAAMKLKSEREVLEAELPNWVVLRQTGVLHRNFFTNNINDGIMFHTCWNAPIEWVTDETSGIMLKNLLSLDSTNKLKPGFWNKVYNIGGGSSCRETGYDTYNQGFNLMGAGVEDFFKPSWNIQRGFHCLWFEDSSKLNDYLNFQGESVKDFWAKMAKWNAYYKLGVIVPKSLISFFVLKRLFLNTNSPMYWVKHNKRGRVQAFYGGYEKFKSIPDNWKDYPVFSKGETPTGKVDYNLIKDIKSAKKYRLDHGYDETKDDSELTLSDMKKAAEFRGGKVLSTKMKKGDLTTKLMWQCSDGHIFESSPYTILKTGHWCPECCQPKPWIWSKIVKHSPFHAQVYNDSFDKAEDDVFPFDEDDSFISYEKRDKVK